MKSRLVHFALIALGAAAVILSALEKVPKYAAIAGGLALLIADARKLLAPVGAP